jgi:hypothetical protein
MLRTVRGHAALAELLGAEYLVHLEDLVKAERLSYRTATWLRALGYLQDDILANPGLAQLSRPERHAIKNAFHGFNEVFHEIYFSQKGYTVPDASLREQVRLHIDHGLADVVYYFCFLLLTLNGREFPVVWL